MNREDAGIWVSFPKEKLAVVAPWIYDNFDVISAFSKGEKVEVYYGGKWSLEEDPTFSSSFKWRVKPKKSKRWIPKEDEVYYFISAEGDIFDVVFKDKFVQDKKRLKFNNCFKTKEQAKAALSKISEFLKKEALYD